MWPRGCGLGFMDELGCLRWIYHPGIQSPPPILNPLYIEYEFPLWYIIMRWNIYYKGSVARPYSPGIWVVYARPVEA